MAEWHQLTAKIISQKGHCAAGRNVGDEFTTGDSVPRGMCSWAFFTLFPSASALKAGDSFPWEKDTDKTTVACPDAENPIVFEVKRIKR